MVSLYAYVSILGFAGEFLWAVLYDLIFLLFFFLACESISCTPGVVNIHHFCVEDLMGHKFSSIHSFTDFSCTFSATDLFTTKLGLYHHQPSCQVKIRWLSSRLRFHGSNFQKSMSVPYFVNCGIILLVILVCWIRTVNEWLFIVYLLNLYNFLLRPNLICLYVIH